MTAVELARYIHVIKRNQKKKKKKSMSFILYKRAIYTSTIIQHRKRERGKGLSGVGGGDAAIHSHKFNFLNMQPTIKQCNIDYD